eukprot:scaffold663730_cov75-Attheya_sp.AAC.2
MQQQQQQQPLGNNNVQSYNASVNYPQNRNDSAGLQPVGNHNNLLQNGANQNGGVPQVRKNNSMYSNTTYTAANANGVGGPVGTSSTAAQFGSNVSNNGAYPPYPSYGIETPSSASTIPYNGTNVNSMNTNNGYVGVQPTMTESHNSNYDTNQYPSSGGLQPYMGASNLGINGTGYVGEQSNSATSSGTDAQFPSTGIQPVNGEIPTGLVPGVSYPNSMSQGESVTLERNGNANDNISTPFTNVEAPLSMEERHQHHEVMGVGNGDDSGDEFDDFQDAASTAASTSQSDSEKQADHTVNSDVSDTPHGNGGDSGYHSTVSSTTGTESQFHTDTNDAPLNSNLSGTDNDLIHNAPS